MLCCSPHLPQVPRQQLIQVDLLDKLPMGTADLQVPAGGLTVPHIRTGAHPICSVRLWGLCGCCQPVTVSVGMRGYSTFLFVSTACLAATPVSQLAVKQQHVCYRKHVAEQVRLPVNSPHCVCMSLPPAGEPLQVDLYGLRQCLVLTMA
jgi:hypothetical protein